MLPRNTNTAPTIDLENSAQLKRSMMHLTQLLVAIRSVAEIAYPFLAAVAISSHNVFPEWLSGAIPSKSLSNNGPTVL